MKLSKILILFILIVLPVNANTIYNLIKIPNLKIYKNNSFNNLKYLTAKKPFQVGIRNDNVTCFNASLNDINQRYELIEKTLNQYSHNFLDKINLKYIVLCKDLSVSEINAAGVPNEKMKTLIIDINFNSKYFERVIHHEIFHIIHNSFQNIFLEKEWEKFNLDNFKYAECSTCSDRLDLETIINTKGFFTEYSMSTASEDMAEVFSFLMMRGEDLETNYENDVILKNKISFIKKNIKKIDNKFSFGK